MIRALLASILIAAPAYAQCPPLPDALAVLAGKYQEAPRVTGLTSNGALMIVTASAEGGFSVLIVSPDGTACLVASGSALEVLDAVKPGIEG